MARILIYDSEKTVEDAGQAVDMALSENEWKTSVPVRAHGGPKGDQRNISYEFILSGNPLSTAIDFEWYQEYFNDHPWVNIGSNLPTGFRQVFPEGSPPSGYPGSRVFPGSGAEYPWAREQVAIAGAAGVIDHYNITRNVAGMSVPGADGADCRYFPMLVHTLWVRIAIRTTTAQPVGGYPQFRIFAHGGGLTDIEAYSERIDEVFAWEVPLPEE
jgi:hypothetical protein